MTQLFSDINSDKAQLKISRNRVRLPSSLQLIIVT